MPTAAKVKPEEKEEIMRISAELKANNPQITNGEIGKLVHRSEGTVRKVMSDKKFERYVRDSKKKVDDTRYQTLILADKLIQTAVKGGKLNPYQMIGLSKTYYEQLNPNTNPLIGGANSSINVQVVRGGISYNDKKKKDEAK